MGRKPEMCHFEYSERKELICLFIIQAIQEIQTIYNCFDWLQFAFFFYKTCWPKCFASYVQSWLPWLTLKLHDKMPNQEHFFSRICF